MPSSETMNVARKARAIYDARLKVDLEATHREEFVAIEPESGDYYFGQTLSEAIQAARTSHPNRLPFTLRVGHGTTVDLGLLSP